MSNLQKGDFSILHLQAKIAEYILWKLVSIFDAIFSVICNMGHESHPYFCLDGWFHIVGVNLYRRYAWLARCLFFHCVAHGCVILIVSVALILDGKDTHADRVDDEDVDPIAVNRAKCVAVRRPQHLA